MRIPWTARRSNQSVRKEINPDYSLEGLMPKLKLQYFDHLMPRINSLEKTLMLGKTDGKKKGKGQQRKRRLDSIINSMDMNLIKLWEIGKGRKGWQSMGSQRVRHNLSTEQQHGDCISFVLLL